MAYSVYPNEVRLVGGISLLIQTDLTTAQATQTLHCILACHGNDKFKVILPYTYAYSQLIFIHKKYKKISPRFVPCLIYFSYSTYQAPKLQTNRARLRSFPQEGPQIAMDFSAKKQRCFNSAYLSVSV